MITIRPAAARGAGDFGWLSSRHSFSFGHYFDRAHMGFRSLRVINEDRVAPSAGFPTHGHSDMEILSYVLSGALEHKDSMGNGTIIRPGEVQIMSAGTGVRHSEYNPSASEPAHFLQIWIETEAKGATPRYEQKAFPVAERQGRLRLVASRDGREGSVTIRQDAALYAGVLGTGESVRHSFAAGRHGWVQVARGEVSLDGQPLGAGDGAAISDVAEIALTGQGKGAEAAEILVFDLA